MIFPLKAQNRYLAIFFKLMHERLENRSSPARASNYEKNYECNKLTRKSDGKSLPVWYCQQNRQRIQLTRGGLLNMEQ
ncbi:hypothetical protein FMK74_26595 [Klebsiella pneumoniae]|nr:hypothetical protein [Klebsiella pneumoniae]HBX8218876.1 hypothetical protein [Klebsiella pneumoniae]